ncbi:hypothetical protein [Altericroceibacterium endophyticum]|uniref:Uncharacterized protein n=1 Tax=Altericroceibacterium endophyticum TaxID=1808508 RepID=A0A6I4T502_9SPHN|nr:hypothetical protein [Altericroceibacterium endophyticum]MXO65947.1 hypothetical protein [Altericroceibacterium endophyticum]
MRAAPRSERLARLLEELNRQLLPTKRDFDGREPSFEDGSELQRDQSDREIVLLDLIGFEPEASDLDVLERMVEMNRTAGT